jgi:hypothetical protein
MMSCWLAASTKHDAWPAPEIKPLERMRMGRTARDVQEVTMTLRPTPASTLDALRGPRSKQLASSSSSVALPGDDQLALAVLPILIRSNGLISGAGQASCLVVVEPTRSGGRSRQLKWVMGPA